MDMILQETESSEVSEQSSINNRPQGEKRSHEDVSEKTELPEELKRKFQPLKCELCDVEVTSTLMAYTHYEGKSHLKHVNSYMKKHYNIDSVLKKKKQFEPLKCQVCDIDLTSEIVYQQHLSGKLHKKKMKKSKEVQPLVKIEIDPTGRFGIGKPFLNETDESVSHKSNLFCELCNVFTNTEQQMSIHKNGQKHIKKYNRQKIFDQREEILKNSGEYYNENDVWEATTPNAK